MDTRSTLCPDACSNLSSCERSSSRSVPTEPETSDKSTAEAEPALSARAAAKARIPEKGFIVSCLADFQTLGRNAFGGTDVPLALRAAAPLRAILHLMVGRGKSGCIECRLSHKMTAGLRP